MLAPLMTLGEVRNEVLTRSGFSTQGNHAANYHALVDSMIRSAQAQLYTRCNWLICEREVTVPLTEDESDLDWPDDTGPGMIRSIVVVHADTGREYPVEPGVRTNERDAAKDESGRPVLYTSVEKIIRLHPAPDENYTTAIINYAMVPGPTQEDGSLIVVDSEACIQLATMKFMRNLGLPVTREDIAEHERHIAELSTRQSDGDGFQMGGHQSWRNHVQKRNRVTGGRLAHGNGAPYTVDWTPW